MQKSKKRVRKRVYKKITEKIVLLKIKDGSLVVDCQKGIPYRRETLQCKENTEEFYISYCHKGYKWVDLYYKGARRKVSIHRLVWIAHTGKLIPKNHEVHHHRGKKVLYRDGIKNLKCLSKKTHKEYHAKGYPSDWDDI